MKKLLNLVLIFSSILFFTVKLNAALPEADLVYLTCLHASY